MRVRIRYLSLAVAGFAIIGLATYDLASWLSVRGDLEVLSPLSFEPQDGDFKPIRLLNPQPPITRFTKRKVTVVGTVLNPTELVLGVTIEGESRAYPINMLTGPSREILNDTLGGRAIAATW